MEPVILLSDNGSKQPASALKLRALAQQLSSCTGHIVHPVSLQHANQIPVEALHGRPAQVFADFMFEQLNQGHREFILIPLFFGMSKALTRFVPDMLAEMQQAFEEIQFAIADVIYPLPDGNPQLTDILIDHIRQTAASHQLPCTHAVLVDHGSPVARVTEVRNHLADQIRQKLGDSVQLGEAVMERRPGKEYDFNGELLEDWLRQQADTGVESVVVAMQFFLPGRHAGEGGDVAEICQRVMQDYPGFKVAVSPLIADHPDFAAILTARLISRLKD